MQNGNGFGLREGERWWLCEFYYRKAVYSSGTIRILFIL